MDLEGFKTSIRNKQTFMRQVFLEPYFEDHERNDILTRLGIRADTVRTEGILRFSYTNTNAPSETITDEAGFAAAFMPSSLTLAESSILSSLQDYSAIPTKGYTQYEYKGSLFMEKASNYTFTLNTTGPTEVWVDTTKLMSAYNVPTFSTDTTYTSTTPFSFGDHDISIRFFQYGAAGATQKMELKWRLADEPEPSNQLIGCRNLYYNPEDRNRYNMDPSFDENNFVDNLLDYGMFKLYFGVLTNDFKSAMKDTTNTLNRIYVSSNVNNNSNYVAFTCSASSTKLPVGDWKPDGTLDGDINFSGLLSTLAVYNNNTNRNYLTDLLGFIRNTRRMYNALDETIFEKIVDNVSIPIEDYGIAMDPTTGTGKHTTVDAKTVFTTEMVQLLRKITPIERFVLRRMMLLADLVAHAHVAMVLFENAYDSASPFVCQTALADMIKYFVNRIKQLNTKYDKMFESGVVENDILKNLYTNIHAYNSNSQAMSTLSKEFKDAKMALKTQMKTMDGTKNVYQSVSTYTKAFLIVMIVIVATLIAYSVLATWMPQIKWIGAASVGGLAFVTVLVIYLLKSYKMELFVSSVYNYSSWRELIGSASAIDTILQAYNYDMMREINAYIQSTVHIAMILQNTKTYGFINHTIQKERKFYTATKDQVQNAGKTAKASTRMYDLESRNNVSRVNVYIALIILLTFAILGYKLAEGRPVIQYGVLIITGILLFMVALLYILDVERKVRTDGRKFYWGQPTDYLNRL